MNPYQTAILTGSYDSVGENGRVELHSYQCVRCTGNFTDVGNEIHKFCPHCGEPLVYTKRAFKVTR